MKKLGLTYWLRCIFSESNWTSHCKRMCSENVTQKEKKRKKPRFEPMPSRVAVWLSNTLLRPSFSIKALSSLFQWIFKNSFRVENMYILFERRTKTEKVMSKWDFVMENNSQLGFGVLVCVHWVNLHTLLNMNYENFKLDITDAG
jgi:hypothetical protein